MRRSDFGGLRAPGGARLSVRLGAILTLALAPLLGAISPARAFTSAAPGWSSSPYAVGFANNGQVGPIGVVFDSSGNLYVADVLIFAFAPGGGAFVIGDRESATGTAVTFWGAQWANANPTSSGSRGPRFKGFAEHPSAPACGTAWSADPGNSTPPPAGPLPTYMGVLVTSSYSRAGSATAGDTVHIVIVRTNPGYQPNPGHPGTGSVVEQFC